MFFLWYFDKKRVNCIKKVVTLQPFKNILYLCNTKQSINKP